MDVHRLASAAAKLRLGLAGQAHPVTAALAAEREIGAGDSDEFADVEADDAAHFKDASGRASRQFEFVLITFAVVEKNLG